ncbi:hypothetical protein ZIOFF_068523 [Zingiber officinale]|uniref:S1 motif domain-containing protein n=1 Tax=Zingiber officinale TaxID=94328 RepID=A0A8J5CEK6_ZINOF|nr:hypothetical protein ZIOFF_068523 [Zingiber officinale]
MEAFNAFSVRLSGVGGGGSVLPFRFPSRTKRVSGRYGHARVLCCASPKDRPELNKWDMMELKFGRLLGEDPKLTLAKTLVAREPLTLAFSERLYGQLDFIMARKLDPNVSYLDVEKSFYKNKGKMSDYALNIPSDVILEELQPPKKPDTSYQKNPQNVKDSNINLSRPTISRRPKTMKSSEGSIQVQTQPNHNRGKTDDRSEPPNISLRKPTVTQDDDFEINSKFKIEPNVFLKMRKTSSEDISNMSLLRKPEVVKPNFESTQQKVSAGDSFQTSLDEVRGFDSDTEISNKGEMLSDDLNAISAVTSSDELQLIKLGLPVENNKDEENLYGNHDAKSIFPKLDDGGVVTGSQPPNQSASKVSVASSTSRQASLLGKPQRLDTSTEGMLPPYRGEKVALQLDEHVFSAGTETVISADQEESDWKRAEYLLHSGEKAEVELISCSSRGFVVSFGSLLGFLPYRHLGAKWKFLAFESWLRKKGVDPSLYRQNLSIVGSFDVSNKNLELEEPTSQESYKKTEVSTSQEKFEELLEAYNLEKTKFLSSFIGQRLKGSVILADRKSRKIMFSGRPKEKEELVEKKRSLMNPFLVFFLLVDETEPLDTAARLNIGDVVKCQIKKITFFGIFVEVEGVPALVHQSEISWDATLDPSSYYKVGQMVEAKVHQLDYTLERIFLSLRDIMPDPLMEALESVIGDGTALGGKLEATQADVEWADVDLLIEELQKIEGISSVSKGRFFKSLGLAPTFQVYMASMFRNKYKLLARFENKIQEIIVESSLDKEQMKTVILTCTSKVN